MNYPTGVRIICVVLAGAIGLAHAGEAWAQERGGRILIETVSSGAVSVVGAVAVGLLGAGLNQEPGDDETVAAIVGAAIGTSVGAGAGAALGARLAGAPTGIARPLMGAMVGSAAFFLLRPGLGLDPDYAPFWIAWFALPVAGAVATTELGLPRAPVYLGSGGHGELLAGINLHL